MAVSIIIAAVFASVDTRAQYAMMFRSIDEQNGMSNEVVTCLAEDSYGYIWIGTKTGLERYDGLSFVHMSSSRSQKNLNAAVGNSVADIKHDYDGNIWVATESGVSKFDIYYNRFTFVPRRAPGDSTVSNSYQADRVFVDSDNDAYFFSPYFGLHKYDPENNVFVLMHDNFFKEHDIRYCHMDKSDCFWFVSEKENALYRLDRAGNIMLNISCQYLGGRTPVKGSYAFMDAGDSQHYYFGSDNGLLIYDVKDSTFRDLPTQNNGVFPQLEIKCLHIDKSGMLWIGTNAGELHKYDPVTCSVEIIPSSAAKSPFNINSSTTTAICEDSRGLLWFGTWKGLSFTSLNPQKNFHNVFSDASQIIPIKRYISCFDSYGDTIVIGSDGGGIIFWKKGSRAALASFDPANDQNTKMESSSVLAVAYDRHGYCYNGGYNRSVTRIHPDLKTIDVYHVDKKNPDAMHSDYTTSILYDSKERIWVLTNGDGLYLLEDPDKGKFRNVNIGANGTSIASPWGMSLAEYQGKILIGTYQGLSVYDPDTQMYTNYESNRDNSATSLSHNWVVGFCIDNLQRIWVATNAGFDLFDIENGTFTTFDTGCGLLSDAIQGILCDDDTGLLWVSTAMGISKFDPSTGKVIRTYLATDGLMADHYQQQAAFKDSEGTMYFGVANGFSCINPKEIRPDTQLRMPTITRLMLEYDNNEQNKRQLDTILSDKAPEATSEIVLGNESGRTIIIQFAALNFVNEAGNKYSYMLKGFDDKWVDIGTRHEAVFTNLDYGDYVFMVKCSNADGVESDVRPLKITILRPFWAHPLVFILIALVVVGILIGGVVMYNRATIQRQKTLETTVKKRTEDLVMANVSLEIQKEEIEKSLNSTLILNDLSRQITSSFDAPTIIMTAYNHIKMMVKMDFFALGVCSASKQTLEFYHIYLNGQQLEPVSIDIYDDSTESRCMLSNEDTYVNVAKSHFRAVGGTTLETMFVLPLREASKANGILTIGCISKDVYTSSDRANIRMITSYLSIALEKAKDYRQLQIKNNAINGSIRYAKTIQDAILVHEKFINNYFNAMIIFRPKDIVSGDFYWFKTIGADSEKPEKIFAAVVDCTGHGVPGAFMSLISNILLNDIIIRNKMYEPDMILSTLDKEIVNALNQANNDNEDGLDMAICRFDRNEEGKYHDLVYAGAKNPLYHYKAAEQKTDTITADRISIGGFSSNRDKVFTSHKLTVQSGDCVYMTSDGIIDQNNVERKRFGRVRLVKTIEYNPNLDMNGKKQMFEDILDDFMEGVEQRDDITIMGLKIS
ncbi:MAG: SpoIIE family protein phosphatase [Bacteroidales bacterium]|nr:SpoIIE family protein phosphatase [Bacteroidales bacterium]